ncbi:hypothetical protein RD792_005187 [Penstemon davidsonii]|uniref:RING-type E3 ubiquitin transferase n=1 Tax=Penstemon davidsonii TaxID=160366 RepID=A0ABR0DJG5_9LAMI|nr:hypothetical protein RD792_005187 [Penstemon davidsonii]
MKTTAKNYEIISLTLLFLFLSPEILLPVGAQPGFGGDAPPSSNLYPYARFSPSLAIIIAVLITSLFFMVLFTIYIRHCSGVSSVALPNVSRRAAAVLSRGLDRSILETFPIFSYSEVKEHKIGKGVLECAVCLSEFEDDETLRLIPKCDHVFHPECIDAWLESHVTCPVCRANLIPQPGDEPVRVPDLVNSNEEEINEGSDIVERSNSRNDEVVIQIDDENQHEDRLGEMKRKLSFQYPNRRNQERARKMNRNLSFQYPNRQNEERRKEMNRNLSFQYPNRQHQERRKEMNRNLSFQYPNRPQRSWSFKKSSIFGFSKFRSYSTGHLLVEPGEDLDRFTLRLPELVRKEVIDRALLNRTRSFATILPREEISKKGHVIEGGEEGTSVTRRFYGKIETSDREVKSDRWDFFTRALSMTFRSPRGVVRETGECSGSTSKGGGSRTPVKMMSFKCLEPKAADETGLPLNEPARPPA